MEFAYLRAGRGKPSSGTLASGLDAWWPIYVREAQAAGLQRGGYWRFYPSVPLAQQVDLFAQQVNDATPTPLELPPMVDIEDADGLSQGALTDWAVSVLAAVRTQTGTMPVMYTYRWFLADALDAARLAPWPLALAAWTDDLDWPDERAVFWQYAGNAVVPWAAGRVDLQRRRTT